jgi:hypothetical protein
MEGYRMGLKGPALDYAVRKYNRHRSFENDVTYDFIEKEFKNYLINLDCKTK